MKQIKNSLIIEQANKKAEIDERYYNRYQGVLQQINTENALAENVRQFNEKQAEEIRQYNQSYALQQAQLEEEKRQYNQSYALQQAQLEEEKRQYNQTLAFQKEQAKKSSSSGGGGGSTIKKSSNSSKSSGGSSSVKKSSSSSGTPTVDMASVTALGYGPISASKLNSLVASGEVLEYESGGKLKYKRASTPKASATLNASNLPNSVKKKLGLK